MTGTDILAPLTVADRVALTEKLASGAERSYQAERDKGLTRSQAELTQELDGLAAEVDYMEPAPVCYCLNLAGDCDGAHQAAIDEAAASEPEAGAPEPNAEWQIEAEAAAWGGRGPSASYAEWVAEGRTTEPEAEAG